MSPPAAIRSHLWQCPASSRCDDLSLSSLALSGGEAEMSLDATSHSCRSTTPRTPVSKTAQNSLDKCPTDNVEWEVTPNTVSRAASAATKPKSTPPLSPALKSSLHVTQGFGSSILTLHPFTPRRGPVLILCSTRSLGTFFFPCFFFALFLAV